MKLKTYLIRESRILKQKSKIKFDELKKSSIKRKNEIKKNLPAYKKAAMKRGKRIENYFKNSI